MVDTFRRLLYDISKQLSTDEVKDLVYLCKVPPSAKTKIQDGKELFRYLEESGVINAQRVYTLKKVIFLLRPKRQDLLDLVDEKFPEEEHTRSSRSISICTTNTVNTITSEASGYSIVANSNRPSARQSTNEEPKPKKYFIVDCYCAQFYGCSITKPFCCCYGVTVFLLFSLLISVIFWFSGKPETLYTYLNAEQYRKDIGFILVSALSFLLVVVILPYLIREHGRKIFSWCNKKRHVRRSRSSRSRRQLLRESQALSSHSSLPVTSMELNVDTPSQSVACDIENPVLDAEAAISSANEMQFSNNDV